MRKFIGTIFSVILLGIILIISPTGDGLVGLMLVMGGIAVFVGFYAVLKLFVWFIKSLWR